MVNFTLFENISDLPLVSDSDRAAIGVENWLSASRNHGLTAAAKALADDAVGQSFLRAIFGNSPFLSHGVLRDPGFMLRLAEDGPAPCFDMVLDGLDSDSGDDSAVVMERLRVARGRVALLVAAADITGQWPLERVTGALSRFAEAALGAATAHLLRAAAEAGDLRLADHANPEAGSGLTILGLGKLGADELNYSSDIDLMVLYDPAVAHYVGRDGAHGAQPCFVRMTRQLVRVMQERTAHGYVFRTDLRLRPDPGVTPPALSVEAAETYYESLGQNWERAAMIKARPVAELCIDCKAEQEQFERRNA